MKNQNYQLLFFFITLITFSSFSQKFKNVRIVYGTKLVKVDVDKALNGKNIPNYVKTQIEESIKNAKSIDFELIYDNGNSKFSITDDYLKSDLNTQNIIGIMAKKNTVFYFDKKTGNILGFKQAYGDNFIIKYDSINWKITGETKKIGKYNAYKAIYNMKIHNPKLNNPNKQVIAWFTNEIPISVGPTKFIGLPGAILELHVGKLIYFVKSIELNTKTKVSIPKYKDKVISEEEFNKISTKISKKIRQGL